jgi:hypothetical protein
MDGAVERSAKLRPCKGLSEGAGENDSLRQKENFDRPPHLEVTAALRAWAERQPPDVMFIAETLAEQVEALAECPDSDLVHGLAVGSLRRLEAVAPTS